MIKDIIIYNQPPAIKTNSCDHLIAEIELLRPDLVVVHGMKEQWRVLNHMRLQPIKHLDLGDRIGVTRVLYSAPDMKCHFERCADTMGRDRETDQP